MNKVITIIIFFFVAASFISVAPKKPTRLAFIYPKTWPKPTYNFKENPLTVEGFEFGKTLFYDNRLSKDSSISCNSCHQQFAAFSTYDHNLSHGILDSLTHRNATALQNLAWKKSFMADGGIMHLDKQPNNPLTAPNEMGETLEHLIQKINTDITYRKLCQAAFGTSLITPKLLNKAISQYVLMLVSSNSKYDKVMRGETTFILPEQLGYDIFKKKCISCHSEPFFSDDSFRNIGLPQDNYFYDAGRMNITSSSNDSLKFRVPSLRNIAVTAPYTHDGRFYGIMSMMEHYRKNMIVMPQTDSLLMHKLPLSNFEIGQITAFLYTLTDTSFLKNPLFAPKNYPVIPSFIHLH